MSDDNTKAKTESVRAVHKNKSGGTALIFGYSCFWLIAFYLVFRYFHNKKKREDGDAYFGPHKEKIAYLEAVRDEMTEEDVLRKLLLRRCMTNVRRLWKLQSDRESVYSLMRSGAIEEKVWQDFKAAENGMQKEIYAVQAEAETFKEGWSENIIREAAELCRKEDALSMLIKQSKKEEKKNARKNSTNSSVSIESADDEEDEDDEDEDESD